MGNQPLISPCFEDWRLGCAFTRAMKEVLVLLLPILVLARLRWKDRRVWFLGLLLFVNLG